ncbi:Asparagine--tRNA ligase, cytoplasmic 3 [Linum perenne]
MTMTEVIPSELVLKHQFSDRVPIRSIVSRPDGVAGLAGQRVRVRGWVRTGREQGHGRFAFLAVNDGSCPANLQVIIDADVSELGRLLATGTSISVDGLLNEDIFNCTNSERSGICDTFFLSREFLYVNTPIITTSDCEGAGEMFQVTTLLSEAEKREKDLIENPPPLEADVEAGKLVVKEKGEALHQLKAAKADKAEIVVALAELNKAKENAYLTVSGQLQVETYACGVGNVYTFGPTFRAENSHTSRHLADFWMVEPEIAFADLQCYDDMEHMVEFYDKCCNERLRMVSTTPFERISYTEAVKILEEAIEGGKKFDNRVEWGIDLASEHERFLTEVKFQKPVIVYNYPKGIKTFYMRLNDDSKTVAAMDVLVPKDSGNGAGSGAI